MVRVLISRADVPAHEVPFEVADARELVKLLARHSRFGIGTLEASDGTVVGSTYMLTADATLTWSSPPAGTWIVVAHIVMAHQNAWRAPGLVEGIAPPSTQLLWTMLGTRAGAEAC